MTATPSVTRRLAWPTAAVSVTITVAAFAVSMLEGGTLGDELGLVIVSVVGVGALGTIGAMIASRAGNMVGWVLLAIVTSLTLAVFGSAYAEVAVPRGLPLGGFALTVLAQTPFFLSLALFPAVFLLFPTGGLPSERWRLVGLVYVVALAIMVAGFTVLPGEGQEGGVSVSNPLGIDALEGALSSVLAIAGFTLLACAFASLAAMIVRYRGADVEQRQQIRWLAYVGAIAAATLIGTIATGTILESDAERWDGSALHTVNQVLLFGTAATLAIGIPVACLVAILRYRLYDLDRVVRRTVLIAIMAVVIAVAYVAIVSLGGALVEGDAARLVAAATVALLFQPVRDRARKIADRLVYGERATPYEVLASFTDRVGGSYSADDVLPRMVQVLASAIGAERASVWVRVGDALRAESLWPEGPMPAERRLGGAGLPSFDDDHAAPVRDRGELLGAIVVRMPPGDPMTPQKERLVHDLASQAGLVLRNVRLIEELRASRQRLVAAQDEERRKLERNLHDGAQQQLVALAVQLRLAEQTVGKDEEKERQLIRRLQTAANEALEDLRDLARGIYPPLLADKGLPAALEAQARRSPIPVEVDPDSIGRYPREIESAVYFCTLEALNNVAKYAQATRARILLAAADGELRFEVSDDGIGFDPDETGYGTGLQGMADRLDAIGGRFEVRSASGEGTTVRGSAPVRGSWEQVR